MKTVDSSKSGWERFQVTHSCGHVGYQTIEPYEDAPLVTQYEGMILIAQGGCLDCRLGPNPRPNDMALD